MSPAFCSDKSQAFGLFPTVPTCVGTGEEVPDPLPRSAILLLSSRNLQLHPPRHVKFLCLCVLSVLTKVTARTALVRKAQNMISNKEKAEKPNPCSTNSHCHGFVLQRPVEHLFELGPPSKSVGVDVFWKGSLGPLVNCTQALVEGPLMPLNHVSGPRAKPLDGSWVDMDFAARAFAFISGRAWQKLVLRPGQRSFK
eukprot:52062-Amphidinium_carterae.1